MKKNAKNNLKKNAQKIFFSGAFYEVKPPT